MSSRWMRLGALVLVLSPASAGADWLFTPSLGTTFGRDTHGLEHLVLSASAGWFGDGAYGLEANLLFAPDFFEGKSSKIDLNGGDSHVGALMINGVVGGLPGGSAVDPYVTGGIGIIQVRAVTDSPEEGGQFEAWIHEVGFNVGGGAVVRLNERLAVRADVRYLRSFENERPAWTRGVAADLAPGNFDFFRSTFGVMVRLAR